MGAPKDPSKYDEWLAKVRANSAKGAETLRGKPHPNAGKPRSPCKEQTKEKLREIFTGRPRPNFVGHEVSEETRNKLSIANAGQVVTQEQRDQISQSLTGRIRPDIRDGRLKANGTGDYLDWRYNPLYYKTYIASKERDNYACQGCGITEDLYKEKQRQEGRKRVVGLDVHHIKDGENYPELRFILSNTITYCRSCHLELENRLRKKTKKN